MRNIAIALLQIDGTRNTETNTGKAEFYIRRAKAMGADIALFPEMYSVGYHIPMDKEELEGTAIDRTHLFIETASGLAAELRMAVGITYLESHDPLPRNSFMLFDSEGREVLHYAKVHTCDFGDECRLTPGNDFQVADLIIEDETIRVGTMICYDREFPEPARILMLKGAELILVPNACPMEINRISQLRARAFENMVAIATVNYPASHEDCNGHSTVFDGVAYTERNPVSRDTLLVEAGEEEGIYMAYLDIDRLREYREKEVHGNTFRRPELYGKLVEEEIRDPFIREERRKSLK